MTDRAAPDLLPPDPFRPGAHHTVAPRLVAPGAWRLVAPNPSPWTAAGTNTYLLEGPPGLLVVDPGPDDPRHLAAILEVLAGKPLAAIAVTHSHLDHSALAPRLGAATGAPVLAFGDSRAGVRVRPGALGGGEGVHHGFAPDRLLHDGERLEDWSLQVLHTPGHMGNHLCFDRGDLCLTGDQAMGWASSLVSPPEGDMADHIASLRRLAALGPRLLLPGHGDPVPDGAARLRALLAHRLEREAQVLSTLARAPATPSAIASHLHPGLPALLSRAAARNILAHLLDLSDRGLVEAPSPLSPEGTFRLSQPLDTPGPPR